ncbi:hypothetical protein MUK70_11700 [Dyadobacter chenwenxiniae]|uniref:Uncharacterized protein n=1 Tax=Dyadobacter chenwenxiniae TaxID=2906456 RepID=A0A9X1TD42_9BACT|nr:hypothetical protein [Dyadobacter chenwenxiniae]MCF0059905.1 hypothetical protein [Dyadobacter chenwenxiniae]UON85644.1 hypothetical protein MUK70_11700 [Dyadobacter chenwenxiniae]
MSETNTPGGIRGAILQIIIDEGTAKQEHIDELNHYKKQWVDAGLEKGQWGTEIDGKVYPLNSDEHRLAMKNMLEQYKPVTK